MLRITVRTEQWALAKPFTISRGTMTHAQVVVVEVSDGEHRGRGESCPTEYFGETLDGVMIEVRKAAAALECGMSWDALHDQMPPGAARNAIDCALWDWRAKRAGQPVAKLVGMQSLAPVETVYTISLARPEVMAAAASAAVGHNILKLKFGAAGDAERIKAIRAAVPDKRLIVDANEGWTPDELAKQLPFLAEAGVELLEQPLRAGSDSALAEIAHIVPIAADESCHTSSDLDRVAALYDVINIKLDKTGGLTEALRLAHQARTRDLDLMVGCMLGTSLAMAPAMVIAQLCRFVDIDAPLLIGSDREHALNYAAGHVDPPRPALWG